MSAASLCLAPLRRLQIDPDECDTVLTSLSLFLSRRALRLRTTTTTTTTSTTNTSTTNIRTIKDMAYQWLRAGAGRKFWGGSHQYLILYGNEDDEDEDDEEKPPGKFLEWPENKGEIREGVTRILILLRQNPAALQQQVGRDEDEDEDEDEDDNDDDDDDDEEERPHKGKIAANLVIRPKTKPQQRSVGLAFRPAKRMKSSWMVLILSASLDGQMESNQTTSYHSASLCALE
jgi:hypothetical protein